MTPFATVDDYEAIYGEVENEAQVTALLEYATAFIIGQRGFRLNPDDLVQAANLRRITCALVHRSLSAGDFAGISSYSESGVGYSANVSISNPAGDFYLTSAERKLLCGSGGRIGQTYPFSVPEVIGDGQA